MSSSAACRLPSAPACGGMANRRGTQIGRGTGIEAVQLVDVDRFDTVHALDHRHHFVEAHLLREVAAGEGEVRAQRVATTAASTSSTSDVGGDLQLRLEAEVDRPIALAAAAATAGRRTCAARRPGWHRCRCRPAPASPFGPATLRNMPRAPPPRSRSPAPSRFRRKCARNRCSPGSTPRGRASASCSGALRRASSRDSRSCPPLAATGLLTAFTPSGRPSSVVNCPARTLPAAPSDLR